MSHLDRDAKQVISHRDLEVSEIFWCTFSVSPEVKEVVEVVLGNIPDTEKQKVKDS